MLSIVSKAVAGYLAVVAGCVGTYAAVNGGLYNFDNEVALGQVVTEIKEVEPVVEEGAVEPRTASVPALALPLKAPRTVNLTSHSNSNARGNGRSRKPVIGFPQTKEQLEKFMNAEPAVWEYLSDLAREITKDN